MGSSTPLEYGVDKHPSRSVVLIGKGMDRFHLCMRDCCSGASGQRRSFGKRCQILHEVGCHFGLGRNVDGSKWINSITSYPVLTIS